MSCILIADDDPSLRRLLAATLFEDGRQLIQAEDGLQALELVVDHRPDLVILDVAMPGRDGFSLCRELKGRADTRAIPVFILTARGQSADRLEAAASGADRFFAKPFSPLQLLQAVEGELAPIPAESDDNPGDRA